MSVNPSASAGATDNTPTNLNLIWLEEFICVSALNWGSWSAGRIK